MTNLFSKPNDLFKLPREVDRRLVFTMLAASLVAVGVLYVANVSPALMLFLGLILLVALVLAWRGHLRLAGIFAPFAGFVVLAVQIITHGGIRDTAILGLPAIIIAASLMNGRRGTIIIGITSCLFTLGLGLAEWNSWITNTVDIRNGVADYLATTILLALITVLLWAVISRLQEHVRQVQQEVAERQLAEANLLRLNAIASSISALQDLESIFQTIYQQLQETLPLEAFGVSLYNPQTDEMSYPFIIDAQQRLTQDNTKRVPGGIVDRVITHGESILTLRTAQEVAARQAEFDAHGGYTGIARAAASMIHVPLRLQAQNIGLLSVQSYNFNAYDHNQLKFVEKIAVQAAIAIQNARLFEGQQIELAERQRAEEQLMVSLQEKDLLLKEVHHRVKNNMQVIVSLLSLQAATIADEATINLLNDSQNRVRSMALVHEKLYQSKNLAQINLHEYLQHLATALFHSYSPHISQIDLKFDIVDATLTIDQAIPCGLIANELISNALKHGFPKTTAGQVVVSLHTHDNGRLELAVADNGVGIPLEKNWRQTESLGMQLVQSLVKQLNGEIELIHANPGAKFVVTFKASG